MVRTIAALVAVAASGAAMASPVMLNCDLATQADGLIKMNVQLNEENGTATYSFPDQGDSYSFKAAFAPDHVSFNQFWISRNDLTFKRINDGPYDQAIYHRPPVEFGKCRMDARKRAF
jgi:hypothetical protein